jgi:hypothetical protein
MDKMKCCKPTAAAGEKTKSMADACREAMQKTKDDHCCGDSGANKAKNGSCC